MLFCKTGIIVWQRRKSNRYYILSCYILSWKAYYNIRMQVMTFLKIYNIYNIHMPLPSRHEMSARDLNQISIERDISGTSQKHLKRDVFCVTSLRRLGHISKKMSFPWRLWDVSKTSLATIFGFPKIRDKNGLLQYLIK